MKVLLDENLPKKLKNDIIGHEVFTVSDMSWNSKKNGELLKLMMEKDFSVLLTFDQNIEYQQNFKNYTIAVIVLVAPNNTYAVLKNLIPHINQHLSDNTIGVVSLSI